MLPKVISFLPTVNAQIKEKTMNWFDCKSECVRFFSRLQSDFNDVILVSLLWPGTYSANQYIAFIVNFEYMWCVARFDIICTT